MRLKDFSIRASLFLGILAAACHASPAQSNCVETQGHLAKAGATSVLIGSVTPASGTVTVTNNNSDFVINTLSFSNQGTGDVFINHIEITLTNQQVIEGTQGDQAIGVAAGVTILENFSASKVAVDHITFDIEGTTESIEVKGLQTSGPTPSGASGGN